MEREYGPEIALLNFGIHLCNNKKQAKTLHSTLFSDNSLFEERCSQQASNLIETAHSQSLIIIFKSRNEAPEYALQIGNNQIIMEMDILDIFIVCLKVYYLFSLDYPSQLLHFLSMWELILEYGEVKQTMTVRRIVNILKNI